MSGKAKTAQKSTKGVACPSHGRGMQCAEPHAASPMTRVIEFRRGPMGFLRPKSRWERA